MHKDIDIIAAGYPSLDRIIKVENEPSIGTTSIISNSDNSEIYYGGCNVNVAYACSRLGLTTAPMMRVGSDFETSGMKAFLGDAGMVLDGVEVIGEDRTSCSYMVMTEKGDHITLFYPGAMSSAYPALVDEELVQRAKYGVITVGNSEYNLAFARACIKHKVPIVFGMKCDFDAFPKPILLEILQGCEIVFMNEGEKEALEKLYSLQSITELLSLKCTKVIVVTKGKRGSHIYAAEDGHIKEYPIQIAKPAQVVDMTGGGDAYLSGFLFGYANGKPLQSCGQMGAVVSSFIIEQTGCLTNVPTLEQLLTRYYDTFKEDFNHVNIVSASRE